MSQFAQVTIPNAQPGLALLNAVKAAFVARNTTLNRWCDDHDIQRQNAVAALTGAWNGPKGRELRHRVVRASGLVNEQ